jgi:hypothetical protein
MASDYPFCKIVGVEFAPELADMARKNLEDYRCLRQKCHAIEFADCEATRYPLPPEPSVYYFYNPFGADVMVQVRDRIRQSIEARRRQI